MVSSDVQARLERVRQNEETYQPNTQVTAELSDKALIMLVGPVAVGKTTLINKVASLDPAFGGITVFTTRSPRPDDMPELFDYLPHDDVHVSRIIDDIDQGKVVQYAVHPVTNHLYGSYSHHWKRRYNLLATLSGGVAAMRQLPFRRVAVISLVTDVHAWKDRLAAREATMKSSDEQKRLAEAKQSLQWALRHEVQWVVSESGALDAAAQQVMAIAKGSSLSDPRGRATAQEMIQYLQEAA